MVNKLLLEHLNITWYDIFKALILNIIICVPNIIMVFKPDEIIQEKQELIKTIGIGIGIYFVLNYISIICVIYLKIMFYKIEKDRFHILITYTINILSLILAIMYSYYKSENTIYDICSIIIPSGFAAFYSICQVFKPSIKRIIKKYKKEKENESLLKNLENQDSN